MILATVGAWLGGSIIIGTFVYFMSWPYWASSLLVAVWMVIIIIVLFIKESEIDKP